MSDMPASDPEPHAAVGPAQAPVSQVQPGSPADDAAALAAEEKRRMAQAQLLMRIAEHVDFPSIQQSIRKVRQTARAEHTHINALSDLVLSDVGLTSKLLRVVNAAFYTTAGAGSITSMDRAVALVGVESLELLVASLMVFDRVPKGRDGEAVRHACSSALLSGWLAQQLCQSPKHLETVYLASLFMNLGEMLVAMHAPMEARNIQKKTKDLLQKWHQAQAEAEEGSVGAGVPKQEDLHEIKQRAARDVIGLSYEDLGCEVARQWGWPDTLIAQLKSTYHTDTATPLEVGSPGYLRVLCTAASNLATSLNALPAVGSEDALAAAREACMRQFQQSVGSALQLSEAQLRDVGELAMEERDSITAFLDIEPEQVGGTRTPSRDALGFKPKPPPVLNGPQRITLGLTHALKGLSDATDTASPLDEVIEQLMTDLMEAMRLQRVVVCLRDPTQGGLRGVAGQGLRAETVTAAFQVPLAGGQDLFSLLCRNAKDALVTDAADPVIWRTLPNWFFQKVGARTFAVLPVMHRSVVQGLVYADRQMAGSLVLNEAEFKLLQAVRDQLLEAMRQRGQVSPE